MPGGKKRCAGKCGELLLSPAAAGRLDASVAPRLSTRDSPAVLPLRGCLILLDEATVLRTQPRSEILCRKRSGDGHLRDMAQLAL